MTDHGTVQPVFCHDTAAAPALLSFPPLSTAVLKPYLDRNKPGHKLFEKEISRKEKTVEVILPVSCPLVALSSWPAFLLRKRLDSALHGRLSPAPQADAR